MTRCSAPSCRCLSPCPTWCGPDEDGDGFERGKGSATDEPPLPTSHPPVGSGPVGSADTDTDADEGDERQDGGARRVSVVDPGAPLHLVGQLQHSGRRLAGPAAYHGDGWASLGRLGWLLLWALAWSSVVAGAAPIQGGIADDDSPCWCTCACPP